MTEKLTPEDLARLQDNRSDETRAEIAAKIAGELGSAALSDAERVIIDDILHQLMRDTAVRVRESLAKSLAHNPDVPHDVAMTLAADLEEIAIPILQNSPVLTDEDLVEIIKSGEDGKQSAVARRDTVPAKVANAIIDSDNADAVSMLVGNDGAQLDEQAFDKVLDKYADNDAIKDPMARRAILPVTVSERLISMVSDQLREHIISNQLLQDSLADDLLTDSRERATVALIGDQESEDQIRGLVGQLNKSGRLTATLMLRAACAGQMRFVEEGLAMRADMTWEHAWELLHTAGARGIEALCARAHVPDVLVTPLQVAVDVFHETDYDGQPGDRSRFGRRMLERVLTQYQDLETDELDFLLSKLGHMAQAEMRSRSASA